MTTDDDDGPDGAPWCRVDVRRMPSGMLSVRTEVGNEELTRQGVELNGLSLAQAEAVAIQALRVVFWVMRRPAG